MRSISGRMAGGALIVHAMLALAPAWAQSAESAEEAAVTPGPATADDVEEIVVTAQFREQNLQDIPLAVTAVSGELLEARNQTSIVDIGAFAPNVNLTQATAINANAIAAFIRGIGQDDGSFAFEPGVGIYIDDVYYGTTFGAVLDLVDLERVEVLRGPQGTLSGKNSLGGAVKLFTRKPDADGGGFIEGTYGEFDRVDVKGSVGFTIADGLYARVSGSYAQRDGFFALLDYGCASPGGGIAATTTREDCVIGTQGGSEIGSIRGSLRYAPAGSPLEINVTVDYANNDSEPPPTKTIVADPSLLPPPLAAQSFRSFVPGDPFAGIPFDSRFLTPAGSYSSYENYGGSGNYSTIFGGFPTQLAPGAFPDRPQNSAEAWGIVGTIDYELSDALSLKSITAWREASGTAVLEIDGTPITILKERLTKRHEQFTQELRLSGRVGDFADFTVGGFYYRSSELEDFRITIPTFLFDFESQDPVENRSIAAFAHLELHPTDRFNIIGGLRYTDDKKSYTFSRRNADGSVISGIPLTYNFTVFGLDGVGSTFADDRIDFRLGANYRFSDALMAYAQVSTGFKGGGVNPRPFVPDQVLPFGSETVTTYEAGFKADLFDRAFRLNGAFFYNEYKDIQRTVFVCPTSVSQTCSLPVNAGDGNSKGVELEWFIRPAAGLTIDGSLGYLDFEYDTIDPLTLITIDMVAPFNSEWTASSGVQYNADLGTVGSLTPRLDWTYQSEFFYNSVNNAFNLIDGRSLFNARLTYETADANWSIAASVTNLFDKFYYVAASENIANFGLAANVVGRPREWAITVKRRF